MNIEQFREKYFANNLYLITKENCEKIQEIAYKVHGRVKVHGDYGDIIPYYENNKYFLYTFRYDPTYVCYHETRYMFNSGTTYIRILSEKPEGYEETNISMMFDEYELVSELKDNKYE